jgi:hypothetical protein
MTITALETLRAHALDFGYLYDPRSGEPLRSHGRHLVRTTRGFPHGVLAVAVPGRLAAHVSALPPLIDPQHDLSGALLILPSYKRSSPGLLEGAWVTIQRLRLNPLIDASHCPGETVQSSALVFEWRDYCAHSPFLHGAIAGLAAETVSARETEAVRHGRPRLPIVLSGGERASTATDVAAQAIVGAVVRGATLRLDSRWCSSEAAFIKAFLGALNRLPSRMRGHVSAAVGLVSADRGFQIVWCLDDLGLPPDSATAHRLVELGTVDDWNDNAPEGLVEDDERFQAEDGLISPTFAAPDFHAHVRRSIRQRFAERTASRNAAEAPAVQLARYVAGGDLSPIEADRLLLDLARPAAAGGRMRAGVAAVLTGIASAASSLEDIAAALELCDLADAAERDIRVARVHRLAGELISARLAQTVVVPEDLLLKATQRHALARVIAREFAAGNSRLVEPLRRALAALAKRNREAFRRIAGRALPRDHRILSVWNGASAEDFCLAGALFEAIAMPRRVQPAAMEAVSETLVAEGKWELVREALLVAANGIPQGTGGDAVDLETVASRLRLVSAIAASMERHLPPSARIAAA